MIGFLGYSLAGHDKGNVYVILQENERYVWLSDGKIRTLDKQKKKSKKHIQVIKNCECNNLRESISQGLVTNEMIKRTIKLYCKGI